MRRHGWIGSPEYERLVAVLIEARESAGLTQHELARRMGVQQSMIAKIESRQRNVSVLEFVSFAENFGLNPTELIARLSWMDASSAR